MRRRGMLTAVGTTLSAVAAGCVQTGGADAVAAGDDNEQSPVLSLSFDHVTDTEIAERVHGTVTTEMNTEAAVTGSTTTTLPSPPVFHLTTLVDDDRNVGVHDGTVYRFSSERIATDAGTQYDLVVSDPTDVAESGEMPTIQFEGLPRQDRIRLRDLLASEPSYEVSVGVEYVGRERARSRLIPAAETGVLVSKQSKRAVVTLEDKTPLHRYRVTATEIGAADVAGARFRRNHVVELSNVPDDEQEIVETAIRDHYGVDEAGNVSAVDKAVVDRLEDAEAVAEESNVYSEDLRHILHLFRYDEEVYWAETWYAPSTF